VSDIDQNQTLYEFIKFQFPLILSRVGAKLSLKIQPELNSPFSGVGVLSTQILDFDIAIF
jgi:hypothetical protein